MEHEETFSRSNQRRPRLRRRRANGIRDPPGRNCPPLNAGRPPSLTEVLTREPCSDEVYIVETLESADVILNLHSRKTLTGEHGLHRRPFRRARDDQRGSDQFRYHQFRANNPATRRIMRPPTKTKTRSMLRALLLRRAQSGRQKVCHGPRELYAIRRRATRQSSQSTTNAGLESPLKTAAPFRFLGARPFQPVLTAPPPCSSACPRPRTCSSSDRLPSGRSAGCAPTRRHPACRWRSRRQGAAS